MRVEPSGSPDIELWDSVAGTYATQVDVDWFDGFLERHLGDVAGKRVLDLGCGHGWFTAMLHERGADVVGVDGSERLLEVARQRYPDVEFEQSDLTEGFEGTFDIVVALMVLRSPRLVPTGIEQLISQTGPAAPDPYRFGGSRAHVR